MNQYVTGAMIRELREKKHLTQAELAQKLFVSDKTVSKWENGKGYPDIALLEPIAQVFGISTAELLAGKTVSNVNVSANMLRSRFYVCPVCGNAIHCMGEAVIHCHGVPLTPAQAEETDEQHKIFIEGVEDEYFVRIEHDMTKSHYISFIAALSPEQSQYSGEIRIHLPRPPSVIITYLILRAVRARAIKPVRQGVVVAAGGHSHSAYIIFVGPSGRRKPVSHG